MTNNLIIIEKEIWFIHIVRVVNIDFLMSYQFDDKYFVVDL